jgi:hypothetical protein
MSLEGYYAQLKRFLLEGGEPGPLLTWDPGRISVYANAYGILKESVLGSLFPRIKGSLPPERWERLRDAYFHAHPPTGWEINANAAAFAGFVSAQADLPAFAAQLATYEWTDFALCLVDEPVVAAGPLRLNPTVTLLELDWDFPSWMHQPVEAGPPRAQKTPVLMYRHPSHERTWCRPASAESLLALKLVAEEVPPSRFSETVGLPQAEVLGHVQRGLEEGWLLGALT